MSIKVKQESNYKGNDWWQWSVWLEGPDEDLDQIEYVEYTLHPTFPKPVHRSTNRPTNFRLDASGWGEFMIYIEIKYRNGRVQKRRHWLKLEYPASQRKQTSPTKTGRPTLFLSSGIADMSFANALREALNAEEIEVLMADDIKPGLPLGAGLSSLLERVNTAVVIVSDKPSPWVMREIEAVQKRKIPLTPVIVGLDPKLPDPLRDLPGIHIKDVTDAKSVVNSVAEQIKRIHI